MKHIHKNFGFTLVEMLVVIVILGILTGLTVFGYRSWQQGLAQRQVQSELQLAQTAMENAKNFGSGYPLTLPTSYKSGEDVSLTLAWGDAGKYCLQAVSTKHSTVTFHINSTQDKSPQSGACPTAPVPPSAPAPSAVASSSSSITVTWPNVANATSYTVRYGTGSPNMPTSCTSSPCVVSGLSASTAYTFSVVATNAYGNGAAGTAGATTQAPPTAAPSVPTIASVGVTGGAATVTWGAVSGASSYEVQKKLSSTSTWDGSVSKTTTSHAYTGLSLGATHNFRVRAVNSGGTSAWSSTVTRVTVPTPYNVNVVIDTANFGCGNDGGDTSWAHGTMTWNGASNTYAVRYDVAYTRNSFTVLQVANGYTGSGGGFSAQARSEGWFPQSDAYPLFRVTGVGPNGERSTTANWYGPYYQAGHC